MGGLTPGLESRGPGRGLGQQPEVLPVGGPELVRAGDPERQPGVPPRLARSSVAPEPSQGRRNGIGRRPVRSRAVADAVSE